MSFVLLHGLGGDHKQPLSLSRPVLPPGATVHSPDVRAHGASTTVGTDFRLDTLAAELVPGLPAGPLTIIGISMGAALALRLAVRGDLDISRIVFIRPAFTDEPLPANLASFPVIGSLLRSTRALPWAPAARRAERAFARTPAFRALAAESPLGAEGALEQFRKPLAAQRAARLIEIPRNAAYTAAELASLAVPATVIAADRDPVHPIAIAEAWADGLGNAVLERVPARDESLRGYIAASRAAIARGIDR